MPTKQKDDYKKTHLFLTDQTHLLLPITIRITYGSNDSRTSMGRITIFAADGCSDCKHTVAALQARKLPFTVISITQYPSKRADMLSLSMRMSTPQVFFNTRHVGGADATIALLQEWDEACRPLADSTSSSDGTVSSAGSQSSGSKKQSKSSSSGKKGPVYASVYERYMAEIGKQHDPVDKRFAVPDAMHPAVAVVVVAEEPRPPRVESEEYCVRLPGSDQSTVMEMTEMLKDLIKHGDNPVGATTTYKRSFYGRQVIKAVRGVFDLSDKGGVVFAEQLLNLGIFHSLETAGVSNNKTLDSNALYRLQCNDTPDILNSYRVWTEHTDSDSMRLLDRLISMLQEIELAVTDERRVKNLKKALTLPGFPAFEEAVCELQGVDLKGMNDAKKLVRFPNGSTCLNLQSTAVHLHSSLLALHHCRPLASTCTIS